MSLFKTAQSLTCYNTLVRVGYSVFPFKSPSSVACPSISKTCVVGKIENVFSQYLLSCFFYKKTFSFSKNGQTHNEQGCGQIWDKDFQNNLFSKRECKTNNCNLIIRPTKVKSCYRYGTVRDENNLILYNIGNYSMEKCERLVKKISVKKFHQQI